MESNQLEPLKSGPTKAVKKLNNWLAAIKRNKPIAGAHIALRETKEGIEISVVNLDKAFDFTHPWQVKAVPDPNDQIVSVRAGSCQGGYVYIWSEGVKTAMNFYGNLTHNMVIPGSGERKGWVALQVEWNLYGSILAQRVIWLNCTETYDIPGKYNQDAQIDATGTDNRDDYETPDSDNGIIHLPLAYIEIAQNGESEYVISKNEQMAFHNVWCTIALNNRGWFFGV